MGKSPCGPASTVLLQVWAARAGGEKWEGKAVLYGHEASAPGDAQAMRQLQTAESSLGGTLSRLMVVSESYPELKANANMMQLSEELTSTENRISFARQAFNDGVTDYNTAREKFPASVIASMFQFQAAALLEETQPEVRNAPRVSFN